MNTGEYQSTENRICKQNIGRPIHDPAVTITGTYEILISNQNSFIEKLNYFIMVAREGHLKDNAHLPGTSTLYN